MKFLDAERLKAILYFPPQNERARNYWLCQLLGWGALVGMHVYFDQHDPRENLLGDFLAKFLGMSYGILLTNAWRFYLLSKNIFTYRKRLPVMTLFLGVLAMSVAQTILVFINHLLFRPEHIDSEVSVLPLACLSWVFVFSFWTALYIASQMRWQTQRAEREKLELQVVFKEAELRALQAQVNPHFFFNSLNSIRALIYQDADAAARAVDQLAGMMRYSLQVGQKDTVAFAEELHAARTYLAMEQIRFEQRLQVEWQIEEGLDQIKLPPMALQSLLENAVKYGVEPKIEGCVVQIHARREGQSVLVSVRNPGRLIQSKNSTRVGLENTKKRLALLFGEQASCKLVEENGWVTASLRLPAPLHEKG